MVIETKLATNIPKSSALPLWIRILKKCLPLSNPDFEERYCLVRKWWVEVDVAGVPQRELGFDENGHVTVAGPIGKNFGFWTDSSMTFDASEVTQVPDHDFHVAWSNFETQWQKR